MSFLHIDPKSTHGPLDAHRVLERSMLMANGLLMPVPVLFGRQKLGVVGYDRATDAVYAAPFGSFDDIIDNITQSTPKLFSTYIRKNTPSAVSTANVWYDMWSNGGGDPAAGTFPGAANTAYVHRYTADPGHPSIGPAPAAGETKHVTHIDATVQTSFAAGAPPVVVILYDRVLVYNGCTIVNALTNMTNSVAATRYSGVGVQIMVTSQVVLGGAVNLTALSFNDTTATAQSVTDVPRALDTGTTATATVPGMVNGGTPRSTPWLAMPAGVYGAQRVNSWTCSAAQTGSVTLVCAKPIAMWTMPALRQSVSFDTIRNSPTLVQIPDDAILSLIMLNQGIQTHLGVNVNFAWGS